MRYIKLLELFKEKSENIIKNYQNDICLKIFNILDNNEEEIEYVSNLDKVNFIISNYYKIYFINKNIINIGNFPKNDNIHILKTIATLNKYTKSENNYLLIDVKTPLDILSKHFNINGMTKNNLQEIPISFKIINISIFLSILPDDYYQLHIIIISFNISKTYKIDQKSNLKKILYNIFKIIPTE